MLQGCEVSGNTGDTQSLETHWSSRLGLSEYCGKTILGNSLCFRNGNLKIISHNPGNPKFTSKIDLPQQSTGLGLTDQEWVKLPRQN